MGIEHGVQLAGVLEAGSLRERRAGSGCHDQGRSGRGLGPCHRPKHRARVSISPAAARRPRCRRRDSSEASRNGPDAAATMRAMCGRGPAGSRERWTASYFCSIRITSH
jgi:hypothetical protein